MWPADLALFIYVSTHNVERVIDGFTFIVTFNCLRGLQVTHQIAVQVVSGSIPGTVKVFYACFFCCLYMFLLSNVYSLGILNTLQNVWPILILKVSWYTLAFLM